MTSQMASGKEALGWLPLMSCVLQDGLGGLLHAVHGPEGEAACPGLVVQPPLPAGVRPVHVEVVTVRVQVRVVARVRVDLTPRGGAAVAWLGVLLGAGRAASAVAVGALSGHGPRVLHRQLAHPQGLGGRPPLSRGLTAGTHGGARGREVGGERGGRGGGLAGEAVVTVAWQHVAVVEAVAVLLAVQQAFLLAVLMVAALRLDTRGLNSHAAAAVAGVL